jgi:hypothetical protein
MTHDEHQRIPESLAKQVLTRAAQLDASDRLGVSIKDLRAAAMEAGISGNALDQALDEIALAKASAPDAPVAQKQPQRNRKWRAAAVIVVLIAASLGVFVKRRVVPVPVEEPAEIILPIPELPPPPPPPPPPR